MKPLEPWIVSMACMGVLRAQESAKVDALLDALDDPEPRVLAEVVTAVGVMGPRAKAAAKVLEQLVSHPDAQIRARAATALRQVRE